MERNTEALAAQRTLIRAMQAPGFFGSPVELIETHISWVLLTGDRAYKLKKALDLGFLDYTTLEKRRYCCEEELRLNRRTAPRLYEAAVAITGTVDAPRLGGAGTPIEYAVQMARFPQEALLDRQLAAGTLSPEHIDALAREVAEFHGRIATAPADSPFGDPPGVYRPMGENFRQIRPRLEEPAERARLDAQEAWCAARHGALLDALGTRRREGFIRECHGDLHLGNLALLDGRVTLFDCIEFNPALRWIDVMSELAFLVMDLEDRGRRDFAHRALNAYLERTGDYAGLGVLRLYQHYRAMVRAKVCRIRLGQAGLDEAQRRRLVEQYGGYLALAEGYTAAPRPRLVITHGPSGTGKTYLTQPLLEAAGAVRLRSDVERKRLFGLAPEADSRSAVDAGIYTAQTGDRTYERLAELAAAVVRAGVTAVVDATFLKRRRREAFRALAGELGVPFLILSFEAREATLRRRITTRRAAGRDASEADLSVLTHQLETREALTGDEQAYTVTVDSEQPLDVNGLKARLEGAV